MFMFGCPLCKSKLFMMATESKELLVGCKNKKCRFAMTFQSDQLRDKMEEYKRKMKQEQQVEEIIEIVGLDGKVHYTRPYGHPDILEAIKTEGVSLRIRSD